MTSKYTSTLAALTLILFSASSIAADIMPSKGTFYKVKPVPTFTPVTPIAVASTYEKIRALETGEVTLKGVRDFASHPAMIELANLQNTNVDVPFALFEEVEALWYRNDAIKAKYVGADSVADYRALMFKYHTQGAAKLGSDDIYHTSSAKKPKKIEIIIVRAQKSQMDSISFGSGGWAFVRRAQRYGQVKGMEQFTLGYQVEGKVVAYQSYKVNMQSTIVQKDGPFICMDNMCVLAPF